MPMYNITKKDLSTIRRSYTWLGFNEKTEKPGLIAIAYSMTLPLLVINEICYILYNWNDVEKRFNGLTGLIFYLISTAYFLAALVTWDQTKLLFNIIEGHSYRFPFQSTQKRKDMEQINKDKAEKIITTWYNILTASTATGYLTPVMVFLIRVGQHGITNISTEMMYLALPVYYPKNYDTLPFYFLSYGLQTFYWIQLSRNALLVTVSSFVSFQLIEGDLRLLRLALEEIDVVIWKTTEPTQKLHKEDVDVRVKMFLEYFVEHHMDIQRKIKEAKKGSQLVAFALCTGMSFLVCTSIYVVVKGDELLYKIQEGFYCFSIMYCLYCLNIMGEKVSNEDDNLRRALYTCPWIDKPLWFKKSLHIIMTRTTKTTEIELAGLFTLNLRTFMQTLRAAYSFYNVLINSKNSS